MSDDDALTPPRRRAAAQYADGFSAAAEQRRAYYQTLEADMRALAQRMDSMEQELRSMRADLHRHLIEQQPDAERRISAVEQHQPYQDQRIDANAAGLAGLREDLTAFRAEMRRDSTRLLTSIWTSAIGIVVLIGGHIAAAAWLQGIF